MSDFFQEILNVSRETLGDMYVPCVATVLCSWSILAFAGLIESIKILFASFFGSGKKW